GWRRRSPRQSLQTEQPLSDLNNFFRKGTDMIRDQAFVESEPLSPRPHSRFSRSSRSRSNCARLVWWAECEASRCNSIADGAGGPLVRLFKVSSLTEPR